MNSADDMMAATDVRLDGMVAGDTGTHTVTLIGVDDADNVQAFTFSYTLRADEEVIARVRNVAGANAKALAAKAGHKAKPPPAADAAVGFAVGAVGAVGAGGVGGAGGAGGAGGRPATAGRRK